MQCPDDATLTDEHLPFEAAVQLQAHVSACASCQARIRSLTGGSGETVPTRAERAPKVDAPTQTSGGPAAGSDAPIPRGTTIGRYLVIGTLGEGGMGRVYAAFDPELDRKVALKLLRVRTTRSVSLTEGQARLMREAQAMARLSHPNVVSVHDVGAFEDQVFLAMELVEGLTLKSWLRAAHRTTSQILRVWTEAGRGLAAAHTAGLVHRDFKPDNVLVGTDGRVRVTDFGLARAAGFSAESSPPEFPTIPDEVDEAVDRAHISGPFEMPLTQTGSVMGTPGYISPEQLFGEPVDGRADQFGFCASLYEALYGGRPFAGKTLEEFAQSINRYQLAAPPKDRDVPVWIRRIVVKGLSRRPEDRYPTIDALLEALAKDPRVGRRRVLGLVAGASVVAALVAGGVSLVHRQNRLCSGSAARLDGVWDGTVRGVVEAAFLATARPFAPDMWTGASQVLDAWTERWTTMHTEACEATRLRGEQSEPVLTLRMACLDQRLTELRALTEVFKAADATTVEKAVSAAYALPDVKVCADTQALLARVSPPSDPATLALVTSVRERLARGKALFDAGRLKEALAVVEPLSGEAKATEYLPLQGEALFLLGFLRNKVGDVKPAERALAEAVWAAIAGRDDEVATRAAAWLVFVVGYQQSRFDEAKIWADLARASLARLGGNEPLEALLWKNLAVTASDQGHPAAALALTEKAVALYTRSLGPAHPDTLIALNNLGADLHDNGQYARGAVVLTDALALATRTLGAEHPDLILQVGNLGEALNAIGEYERATELARRAVKLGEANLNPDHRYTAWAYTLLGQSLILRGRYSEAKEAAEQGLARLERALGKEHAEVGRAHELLGRIELGLGNSAAAATRFERSVKILEQAQGKEAPALADPLTGLGRALTELGQPGRAVELLERALKLRGPNTIASTGAWGETRMALARALWDAGKDRPRAKAFAAEARDDFARLPLRQADLGLAAEWLHSHR